MRYAAAGLGVAIAGAWLGSVVLEPAGGRGVRLAAAVAYGVQLGAFGVLLAWRGRPNGFVGAMVTGTLARLGAVAALGYVAWRWSAEYAAAPLLLSAVAFFFLLMLLEPVFYGPAGKGA